MKSKQHLIQGFQGIRGFAILLIIVSHCEWKKNIYGNNILSWAGAWGVSLFIMLSGFLAVLQWNGKDFTWKDALHLAEHKIRKSYGLHFFTFLISLPLCIRNAPVLKTIIKAFFNLTLLHSLIPVSGIYFAFNAVSWYLSLDVILPLLLPIILCILKKMNTVSILLLIPIFTIAQWFLSELFNGTPYGHGIVYISPFSRWIDYFIGGALATIIKTQGGGYIPTSSEKNGVQLRVWYKCFLGNNSFRNKPKLHQ